MPVLRLRLLGVLAVVLAVNLVAAMLWRVALPGFPLRLGTGGASTSTSTGKTPSAPDPAAAGVPAETVVADLLSRFPAPAGWDAQPADPAVVGSVIDARCPVKGRYSAAVSAALSFTRAATSSRSRPSTANMAGMSVTVAAYPAGLGAGALEQLRAAVDLCSGVYPVEAVSAGTETFAVEDDGGVFSSGPSGRTLWVRVGDVVASVSVRGTSTAALSDVVSAWLATWPEVLSSAVCPGPESTVKDVARSPLSGRYTGWVYEEPVTLTAAQAAKADKDGQAQAQKLAASQGVVSVVVPSAPTVLPQVASLPAYPMTVQVALPASPPAPGEEPVWPAEPVGVPVAHLVADPIGPGCGWAFTGMVAPSFTPSAAEAQAQAAKVAHANDLMAARARWWADRWVYGRAVTGYAAKVTAWNRWVGQASIAVAAAWWTQYDRDLVEYRAAAARYPAQLSAYTAAHAAWVSCTTPTPRPSSSTTPTPAPTSTLPVVCGAEPVAPVPPVEPLLPSLARPLPTTASLTPGPTR